MAKKEVISCKITHKMERYLTHYGEKHGLNQSEIYELVVDKFATWFEHKSEEDSFEFIAMPNTGIFYRGAVPPKEKERIMAIADTTKYPLMDVYYSMLRFFCNELGFESTVAWSGQLSQDIVDYLYGEGLSASEVRDVFIPEAFTSFVSEYQDYSIRKQNALEWEVARRVQGVSFEAYIDTSAVEALNVIRRTHQIPLLEDVYHHVIAHAARQKGWTPRQEVHSFVSKDVFEKLNEHIKNEAKEEDVPTSMSHLMSRAAQRFAAWHASSERPKGWVPLPVLNSGEVCRGYIPQKAFDALGELPMFQDEALYNSVMHYAEQERLLPGQKRKKKKSKTPSSGLTVVWLYPEQDELIRFLVMKKKFESPSDFYNKAAEWWIAQRQPLQGLYDQYMSRAALSEEDGAIEVTAVIKSHIHDRITHIKNLDGQSLRNVYNHAFSRYLDELLDEMSEEDLQVSLEHLKE